MFYFLKNNLSLTLEQKKDKICKVCVALNLIFSVSFTIYFSLIDFQWGAAAIIYSFIFLTSAPLWWSPALGPFWSAKIIHIFMSFLSVMAVSLYLGPENNTHLVALVILIDSILYLDYTKYKFILFFVLMTLVAFLLPVLNIQMPHYTRKESLGNSQFLFRLSIEFTVLFLVSMKIFILALLHEGEGKKLNHSAQSLKTNLDEKHQLVRILGHDLKTPVSTSIKALHILKDSTDSATDSRAIGLITLENSLQALKETIENVVQKNSDTYQIFNYFRKTCLQEILEKIQNIFQLRFLEKKVNLVMDSSKESLSRPLKLDVESTTHQILGNIISNAIKFSPENSAIHITTQIQNHQLICKIRNQGQLPAEILSGQTFSTQGTWGERGSGLGLEIIKKFSILNQIDFKIENRNIENLNYVQCQLNFNIEHHE